MMQHWTRPSLLALSLLSFSACDQTPAGEAPADPASRAQRSELTYGSDTPVASCAAGENLAGGRTYQVIIPSRVDGEPISFQLHEPAGIDCGAGHALILQGHGYSGSRTTEVGAFAFLTDAGYPVISIDQRGSGDSGGTVRVMDPDFEGEDLVAIVDWAEQHLDWLRQRDGNLLLGSIGGSYGGMYQYLLLNKDPDRRLDAIVPEIAPHDLIYSLAPGGVTKGYWTLVLAGAGDGQTSFGQDPLLRASLIEGGLTGRFPAAMLPFFAYRSLRYFCENPLDLQPQDGGDTGSYIFDPAFQLMPLTADGQYTVLTPSPRRVPRVDALLWQGPRDDLFNLNEAWRNYQCLQRAGGDVRLLTYSFGHHILAPNLGLIEQGIAGQTLPLETQCGPIDKDAATLAWFDDKLLGRGDADAVISSAQDICFSLDPGDAVALTEMLVGGSEFPVSAPGGLPLPVLLGDPAPQIVPLTTAAGSSQVLAGIPTAELTLSYGDPMFDALCQQETDPLLRAGTCDATLFVGVGVIKQSSALPLLPELIEEQVMPLRGIGTHQVELVGVAERIRGGDQIVLLIYGQNDAFVTQTSRDPSTAVVGVSGSVQLPLHGDLPAL